MRESKKYSILRFSVLRNIKEKRGGRKSQVLPKFRVRAVMTTSIPIHIYFTNARMIITNPAEKIKSGGTISVNSAPPAVEFPQILLYSILVRADQRRKYA